VLLADELLECPRPEALRERRDLVEVPPRRVGEEVAHATKYAQAAVSTVARPLVSRLNVVYVYVREWEQSLRFYRDPPA
jgi:hypothetical protein